MTRVFVSATSLYYLHLLSLFIFEPLQFVLEDGEYLTAVEVSYIAMAGTPYPKVASLRFKTNKRESALFGMDAGEKVLLGAKNHKITDSFDCCQSLKNRTSTVKARDFVFGQLIIAYFWVFH